MRHIQNLALLPLAAALLVAGAAQGAGAGDGSDPDAPQPVTVAVQGSAEHDAVLKYFARPYADATGTALAAPVFDGSAEAVKALVAGNKLDLALVNGATLTALCRAQVFGHLDWSALGRDRFFGPATSDCGAGAFIGATVLAWDQAKLHSTPNWGDFWDVAKFPGRRGLQKGAERTLEIALLADGVAPGDLYRTLRTPEGVDRAFRKLDQLKPYVEWWDQPGQPAQFLASGKVLMTSGPSALLQGGGKSHLGLQWGSCLDEVMSWAIPHGAPHGRAALAVVGIASDAARQAEFARATGLGPAIRTGFALLPEDARAANPASPEHLQSCTPVDDGFWLDNGDKLGARFTAWLSK